jgi:glutamate--cysteine ligase
VKLLDLSRQAVALAQAGLRARARAGNGQADEAGYLGVLADSVERGQVQADWLLAQYHGAWGGRLDPVYEAVSY